MCQNNYIFVNKSDTIRKSPYSLKSTLNESLFYSHDAGNLLFPKMKPEIFSPNTATCYCNYCVNKIIK
jgi:hypothetical protein